VTAAANALGLSDKTVDVAFGQVMNYWLSSTRD
jgi:hypothetical protein